MFRVLCGSMDGWMLDGWIMDGWMDAGVREKELLCNTRSYWSKNRDSLDCCLFLAIHTPVVLMDAPSLGEGRLPILYHPFFASIIGFDF